MQAAAQHVGLVSGFALQSDEPAFGERAVARPELLDDADLVVGDPAQAEQPRHDDEGAHGQTEGDEEIGDDLIVVRHPCGSHVIAPCPESGRQVSE